MAISRRLGIPEATVRSYLKPGVQDKLDVLQATSAMLKQQVDDKKYIDIGAGVERQLGISKDKLNTAVAVLKEQGYTVHSVQVDQLGTQNKTTLKVLCPPGTEYRDVKAARHEIRQIKEFSEDGGRSYLGIHEPLDISSKRVKVVWDEDGGSQLDGTMYIRPGVKDVSIGNARYAQVRVSVDGTHYLKGMAVYKDDMPPGVDIMFHTNKSRSDNKLDAMKAQKDDPDNPFGATIRQMVERDPVTGKERVTSAMNIVGHKDGSGEEGSWDTWSRNLPSQFLSKQSTQLAKTQLDMTHANRKAELDEIMKLTNPTVKRELLRSFAESTDSAAVHLKAAQMPGQSTHVIMPVPQMKPTEIYAPNFNNGDRVALVRFPHGGTFEIPELVVNNNQRDAKKLLGTAKDAVGINHKVAERLSGADFDGDTVLVIPNNHGKIKSSPALEDLKGFDSKRAYPKYDGMPTIDGGRWSAAEGKVVYPAKGKSKRGTGFEMGMISNLITDMTIKGATDAELARAVKHSMVVIDAEKHVLDYKYSEQKNGIAALRRKYQENPQGGASTLISRATSQATINKRKPRSAQNGGPIDPKTGKKVYEDTGEHWVNAKGKVKYKTEQIDKLALTDDAHTLVSKQNTKMEQVYADHSNRLKALADEARLATLSVKDIPYSPSAKTAYASEVKTLNSKLNTALLNSPRERSAQILANAIVDEKRKSRPDMDVDELKKIKSQALAEARVRTGAKKTPVVITTQEWAAIQAGAISPSKLKTILENSDLDTVKQLAMPKQNLLMSPAKANRAKAMADQGYTQAEIASQLGVSVTTLKRSLT
jgi:predicted transcriptional regulator